MHGAHAYACKRADSMCSLFLFNMQQMLHFAGFAVGELRRSVLSLAVL